MRVLVVGAGAVGQVYGHHLAKGGASVSLFVRDKYATEARRGFDLIRIHSRKHRVRARFEPQEVLTRPEEVAARSFRQVWLTVATPPLLNGDLDGLLRATGDATIVCLQPGMSVGAYLARVVPAERTVFGTIGMQSFHAPLEGSEDPIEVATGPGIAYNFPPFVASMFGGPSDRARAVADALHAGDAPARFTARDAESHGGGEATLIPMIAGLEAAGWSFERFREPSAADLAARAVREAMGAVAANSGKEGAPLAMLVRGPIFALATRVAPLVAPLDIEAFLRYHFRKVGDQTRLMLAEFSKAASEHGLEHSALDELRGRLGESV